MPDAEREPAIAGFAAWEGVPLILSEHADESAFKLDIDVWDIAALLEDSEPCKDQERSRGILERCVRHKGGTLKIIVARGTSGWVGGSEAFIVINIKPLSR